MTKKIFIIILCLFYIHRLLPMDCVQKDHFSTLSNSCRRPIIFPLLGECKTLQEARKIILSIGLLSRKSYEQINCPFFIRDVVKLLANEYKQTNEAVATQLRIAGAYMYNVMGCNLIHAAQVFSDTKFYQRAYPLLYQGVDFNFRCMGLGITPLMCAVGSNKLKRVHFFVSHGASVHDCDAQNKSVRAYNLIYDKNLLESKVQLLTGVVLQVFAYNQTRTQKIRLYDSLYGISAFSELINALHIDRYLADKGGLPIVKDDEHPLIVLIKKESLLRNIIQCAFNYDQLEYVRYLPVNIRQQL